MSGADTARDSRPTQAGRAERLAPWIEGLLLALLVLVVFVLGGEAVRASYHGYLKTAMGEAVLRDGLVPENPHHAGTPLRYYTLYSTLAVLIGRLGPGPLWGFALLSVLSALLFGPALDALGRAFGLSFGARRASFLAAVLGLNGLGWLGFFYAAGEPFGRPPVFALMPTTFAREAFGWDARLQAFVTKYFNVSSHTLTLPFALWALAACVPAALRRRTGRAEGAGSTKTGESASRRSPRPEGGIAPRETNAASEGAGDGERVPERTGVGGGDDRAARHAEARPWFAAVMAALALAMNPLIGGLVGVCMLAWIAPTLVHGPARARRRWLAAGALAFLLALPTLLPAFHPAPSGAEFTGAPALGGRPLANLIGPLVALLVPGVLGLRLFAPGLRWRWIAAILLLSVCVVFVEVPERSEYKLARTAALLWAIAAGAGAAQAFARGGWRRAAVVVLALACVPTSAAAVWAYVAWGRTAPALPLRVEHGRLTVDESAVRHALPAALLAAEARADPRAVVVMHPHQPGTGAEEGLVQGNALAAVLRHPLFVDLPQIDNDGIEDLGDRLDEATALFEGRGWTRERRELSLPPADALARIRSRVHDRPLLVIAHDSSAHVGAAIEAAGGSALERAGGYALWMLPAFGE